MVNLGSPYGPLYPFALYTYSGQAAPSTGSSATSSPDDSKTCPICAKQIKPTILAEYMVGEKRIQVGIVAKQIAAWTFDHAIPNDPDYSWQLRHALTTYITQLPFHRDALIHVELSKEFTALLPSLVVPIARMPSEIALLPRMKQHPIMFSNIFHLTSHREWPIYLSDMQVEKAQAMVGYFTGKRVRVKYPMGRLERLEGTSPWDGFIRDTTVELTDENWVEPFEPPDGCQFCTRMTDEDVQRRVSEFQWAIDKETYNLHVRSNPEYRKTHPDHSKMTDRVEYHRLLKQWEDEHPSELKTVNLLDLPDRLKMTLCVQWNHDVRDWLEEDHRYVFVDGEYLVVYTEPFGPPHDRRSRSSPHRAAGGALRSFVIGIWRNGNDN